MGYKNGSINHIEKSDSRKKFLKRIGVITLLAAAASSIKWPLLYKNKKSTQPGPPLKGKTKMLTQDGRLVEVDISGLSGNSRKLSHEEIQNWVNTKKNS
jgi:hypothetical protein